jgi:hypothetical protein
MQWIHNEKLGTFHEPTAEVTDPNSAFKGDSGASLQG